ncbi:hypothetical protein Tco_0615865 [Tanacetum coccineum]
MLDFKRTLRGRSLAKVIENQVMVAPIILILSNSSEESVGSHALRVILFGVILAIIPVISEVPIVPADPIVGPKDSLPPVPNLPLVSPFLCSDNLEADSKSEPAKQRLVSSSHDTLAPSSEFPFAPVVAPPRILRWPAILVRPGKAIPFDRLYCTHLNGPRRFNFGRTSLTEFPAQSVRSSNAYALDSSYLLILNTRTSQSRQHDMSESDSYYLSD